MHTNCSTIALSAQEGCFATQAFCQTATHEIDGVISSIAWGILALASYVALKAVVHFVTTIKNFSKNFFNKNIEPAPIRSLMIEPFLEQKHIVEIKKPIVDQVFQVIDQLIYTILLGGCAFFLWKLPKIIDAGVCENIKLGCTKLAPAVEAGCLSGTHGVEAIIEQAIRDLFKG
jgi:hypothetical protein